MVRSFPTRFPNPLTGVVLLVLCLLICLACATSFPIENLQEGMTTERVRDKFGEPESIQVRPGYTVSQRWCYLTEEQVWLRTFFPLSLPLTVVMLPIAAFSPNIRWDDVYVDKREVVLHFEKEKLVWWGSMPIEGSVVLHAPVATQDSMGYEPSWMGYEPSWVRWGPPPCDWPQTGGD